MLWIPTNQLIEIKRDNNSKTKYKLPLIRSNYHRYNSHRALLGCISIRSDRKSKKSKKRKNNNSR